MLSLFLRVQWSGAFTLLKCIWVWGLVKQIDLLYCISLDIISLITTQSHQTISHIHLILFHLQVWCLHQWASWTAGCEGWGEEFYGGYGCWICKFFVIYLLMVFIILLWLTMLVILILSVQFLLFLTWIVFGAFSSW